MRVKILTRLNWDTYKSPTDANEISCVNLAPFHDDKFSSILFADPANHCVRLFTIAERELETVYRCGSDMQVRAILHIPPSRKSDGRGTLLLAECPIGEVLQTNYSLVGALWEGCEFSAKRRLQISSVPSSPVGNAVSLVSDTTGGITRVLAALPGSQSIDIFSIQNTLEQHGKLELEFQFLEFTGGVIDNKLILIVAKQEKPTVVLMKLSNWNEKKLDVLTKIKHIFFPRFLWCGNNYLLIGMLKIPEQIHLLSAWKCSPTGDKLERAGGVAVGDSPLFVNAWCTLGEFVVIYDSKTKNMIQVKIQYGTIDFYFLYVTV